MFSKLKHLNSEARKNEVVQGSRGNMKKSQKKKAEKIETTLGELVEAITQIAQQSGVSQQESYELASLTIEDMLRSSKKAQKDELATK